MALILTVKPGVEDYLDTSFLLRQASPFTKIKFKNMEELADLTSNKRPNQAPSQAGHLKKMKFSNIEASLINEENIDRGLNLNLSKVISGKEVNGTNKTHVHSEGFVGLRTQDKSSLKEDKNKPKVVNDGEYQIMQGLSKALWTLLKQYKEKLEGVEMENCHLRNSLANEKTRSLDLENELNLGKRRLLDLENELKELKSQHSCCREASADIFPVSMQEASFNPSQFQTAELPEVNSEIFSSSLGESEKTENEKKSDHLQLEDLLESGDYTENTKAFQYTSEVDMCSRSQVLSRSTNSPRDLICNEHLGVVDIPFRSQATSQSTSGFLYICHKSEQDAENIKGDVKNLEPESECVTNESCLTISLEYESAKDYEDL